MKFGKTLQELAAELERQNEAKKDFIVDAGALSMGVDGSTPSLYVNNGGNSLTQYGVNSIAHRQLGQFLKIPAAYYDRMRTDNPGLLAQNVNTWLDDMGGTKRMLRTMDGTARALLSERYRRIDNYEIASAVLPIIGALDGARVESCELTDERMYIKVVDPKTTAEVKVGDVVQAGVIVTNSEVGSGSVNVKPLIFRLVCSNALCRSTTSAAPTKPTRISASTATRPSLPMIRRSS